MVVRLSNDGQSERLNVYGVQGARVIWRIKDRSDAIGDYVGPGLIDDKLFVWDSWGMRYQLDPRTGEVIDAVFLK